jgi:hypothetical protein
MIDNAIRYSLRSSQIFDPFLIGVDIAAHEAQQVVVPAADEVAFHIGAATGLGAFAEAAA